VSINYPGWMSFSRFFTNEPHATSSARPQRVSECKRIPQRHRHLYASHQKSCQRPSTDEIIATVTCVAFASSFDDSVMFHTSSAVVVLITNCSEIASSVASNYSLVIPTLYHRHIFNDIMSVICSFIFVLTSYVNLHLAVVDPRCRLSYVES